MDGLALALFAAVAAAPVRPATVRVGLDPRAAPWVFLPGYDYTRQRFLEPPRLSIRQIDRVVGLEFLREPAVTPAGGVA
jgi:hypothetical protein